MARLPSLSLSTASVNLECRGQKAADHRHLHTYQWGFGVRPGDICNHSLLETHGTNNRVRPYEDCS